MPMNLKIFFLKKIILGFTAISGNYPDIAIIAVTIGIFHE
jgi:hypothetical protein